MVTEVFIKLAEKCGIKPSDLAKLLILFENKKTHSEIFRAFGWTPNFTKKVIISCSSIVKFSENSFSIAPNGINLLNEAKLIIKKEEEFLSQLPGISKELENTKAKFVKSKREYDQFFATVETVIKRANLMLKSGDLTGRKVLLLGDDDFLSTVLAKFSLISEISVIDIDEDILKIIKDQEKQQVITYQHDLRNGLPKDFLSKFDTVFTDPPYTPEGFRLFMNIGISALNKSKNGALYICYGNTDEARDRGLKIQKIVAEENLLITNKWLDFNRYNGAESVANCSSLYVLKETDQTKRQNLRGSLKIYTYEN